MTDQKRNEMEQEMPGATQAAVAVAEPVEDPAADAPAEMVEETVAAAPVLVVADDVAAASEEANAEPEAVATPLMERIEETAHTISEAAAPVVERIGEVLAVVGGAVASAAANVVERATDAVDDLRTPDAEPAALAADETPLLADITTPAAEAAPAAAEDASTAAAEIDPADAPVTAEPVTAEPVVMTESEAPATDPAADAVETDGTPLLADLTAPAAADATPDVVEATTAAGAVAAVAAASFDPEAAETGEKPRRLKDLEAGMELPGKVTSIAQYGIFVDVGVGRDGLVHISEMSDTRIDSPNDVVKIGDTVTVRIKSIDQDGRRISLTMRSKERAAEPRARRTGGKKNELNREALAAMKVGDTVDGTITGIAPFGVFVDVGVGKDGLVHVSELAEGRVEKAEDVVQVGQSYTFKILEVDAEGGRISLSLRRAQRGQRMQQITPGMILDGTVSGLATFGAFVDVGVGRDGLVHISELSNERIARVEDAVKQGDKVKVRVIEIDSQSKRISLSMRLEDTPRTGADTAPTGGFSSGAPIPERSMREFRVPTERPPRNDRQQRDDRSSRAPRAPETFTTGGDEDEPFTGDATIEDLMSKYGNGGGKKDRKRRDETPEEEPTGEETGGRRQRDAIRRTLQQIDDE